MVPPLATGLMSLGISYSALHAFAAVLQGVVISGVSVTVPSPSPSIITVKVTTLSLLHLRFACRVEMYRDLPPIWVWFVQVKGRMEGLATLNQVLIQGLSSYFLVIGGRSHFGALPPLLAFVKNMSLMNLSLDLDYTGGVPPWLTRKEFFKSSTCGGDDASLLS